MIVVKDVYKTLRIENESKTVLDNISFHIAENECVGIIGKNGAGKTTMLNVLSGIWKADRGFIRISGCRDTLKDFDVLKKLAYVSGNKSQLWNDLNLKYSFDNCAKMYGIKKEHYKQRLEELLDLFEIRECIEMPVTNLSLGQRIRGELIYALLPEPEILFLDEALIGLDVSIKEKVMKHLLHLKNEKKITIIYTSHNLTEVERLCDRIILIDSGRIIYDDNLTKLMKEYAPTYQLVIDIAGENPDLEDLPVERYEIDGDVQRIWFVKQKIEPAIIIKHISSRCVINDMKLIEPNLEDTIKNIYRKGLKND